MKHFTSRPDSEATLADAEVVASGATDAGRQTRDARFWLVFLGIGISVMITALELVRCSLCLRPPLQPKLTPMKSAVSVALPTIIQDLHGSSFIWVGSAYTLAGTAFIPLSGGLAQVHIRSPTF